MRCKEHLLNYYFQYIINEGTDPPSTKRFLWKRSRQLRTYGLWISPQTGVTASVLLSLNPVPKCVSTCDVCMSIFFTHTLTETRSIYVLMIRRKSHLLAMGMWAMAFLMAVYGSEDQGCWLRDFPHIALTLSSLWSIVAELDWKVQEQYFFSI